MDKPDAPSKSVWYLIAAAIGWEVLAFLPALLLYFTIERGQGRAVSLEVRALLFEIAKLMAYAITFFGIYIQGRIIGHGDVRAGLGYQSISRRPVVALMAILIAALAMLWDTVVYEYNRDAVYRQFALDVSSPWLNLYQAFEIVLLQPLWEELFFEAGCGRGFENIGALYRRPRSRARFGLRPTCRSAGSLGCLQSQSFFQSRGISGKACVRRFLSTCCTISSYLSRPGP
jgi:hypothetical protein